MRDVTQPGRGRQGLKVRQRMACALNIGLAAEGNVVSLGRAEELADEGALIRYWQKLTKTYSRWLLISARLLNPVWARRSRSAGRPWVGRFGSRAWPDWR